MLSRLVEVCITGPPSLTCPVTWTCPHPPGQTHVSLQTWPLNSCPSARSPHGHICIFIGIFACHRHFKYTGMVVQCDREAQLQHLLTGLSIIETGDQYNLPSTPRSLFVSFGQLTTMILLSLNTRWVISFLFFIFCPFGYHMAKKKCEER